MRKLLIILTALCVLMTLSACNQYPEGSTRDKGAAEQEAVMSRAQDAVPVPQVQNFLTRQSVAKWMKRMDKPNKIFYVYITGDNGNIVGYYTAQNRPTSSCTLMTPSDRIQQKLLGEGSDGQTVHWSKSHVVDAPALDGVYYGSAQCAGVFFFDAATDAYIEINGYHYMVTDQPLKVEAQPLSIAASEADND